MTNALMDQARTLIADSSVVLCMTGAGASAESGVPTFRDAQTGLWSEYDPQQLASPAGFAEDPGLVWRWYMWRFQLVQQASPNPGHFALADFQQRHSNSFLVTQNVDDLHERAGSHDVIHLHGSLHRFRCHDCAHPYQLSEADQRAELPPRCDRCGAWVRPEVVWFGESLPQDELNRAFSLAHGCDVMLVVGTSGLVYPAAQVPVEAKKAGARLIEINPAPGPLSTLIDIQLVGTSGDLLPELLLDL